MFACLSLQRRGGSYVTIIAEYLRCIEFEILMLVGRGSMRDLQFLAQAIEKYIKSCVGAKCCVRTFVSLYTRICNF